MLILTRRVGETLMIGESVSVTVLGVKGNQVRIGINAPRNVSIHRKEVFEEIQQENRQASTVNLSQEELKKAVETLHLKKEKKPE